MKVKITKLEGTKLKAESDGFEIISGRVDENSDLEGMMPGRIMVASLGLCIGMHVTSYFKRHKIKLDELTLTVEVKSDGHPRRVIEFNVDLNIKHTLNVKQKKILLTELDRCYVANTLKNRPQIKINLKTP
jgi:uncharacterized OsmC-like protein